MSNNKNENYRPFIHEPDKARETAFKIGLSTSDFINLCVRIGIEVLTRAETKIKQDFEEKLKSSIRNF